MIQVRINAESFLNSLNELQLRQMPYAVSLGLNRLANMAQKAERAHMEKAFTIRRKAFVLRGVKIEKADRATKSSWRVVISLAYPDDRHFLDEHEEGDTRTPRRKHLWQPNREVFKARQVIGRDNPLHPKALTFDGKGWGKERTFLVRTPKGPMVFQRVDRGLTGASKRRLGKLTLDNFRGGMGPAARGERMAIARTQGVRLLYRLVDRVRIPAPRHLLYGGREV